MLFIISTKKCYPQKAKILRCDILMVNPERREHMHTVQILLNTKTCSQEMEKRFRAMTHIHNVCVKHGNKLLSRLEHDKAYQDAMEKRLEASKKLDGLQQKVPSNRKEERELEKQVTAMEKEIKSINNIQQLQRL